MGLVKTPKESIYISNEEYLSKLFELRSKAVLKKNRKVDLDKISDEVQKLIELKNNKKIVTDIKKNNFDIKI